MIHFKLVSPEIKELLTDFTGSQKHSSLNVYYLFFIAKLA